MSTPIKLQLVLKGRPMREFTFSEKIIAIGREPGSTILIDNPGISRNQARIVPSSDGWTLEDSGSANGTWLNHQRVERATLKDRDEITLGKFAIRVGLEVEVATSPGPDLRLHTPSASLDGTTVLTRSQLARAMATWREEEAAPVPEPAPTIRASLPLIGSRRLGRGVLPMALVLAMIIGAILAAIVMR